MTSAHVPPATGSVLNAANAAPYAPGSTTPGAVRAWAYCSAAASASAVSSPASPTLERARSEWKTFSGRSAFAGGGTTNSRIAGDVMIAAAAIQKMRRRIFMGPSL